MMHPNEVAAFRLSRVYAEGWNAARQTRPRGLANPYVREPERDRWQAGFADAQRESEKPIDDDLSL